MDVGNVLSQAVELYRAHWKHFVSIAFVVYVVVAAASLALGFLGLIGVLLAALVSLVGAFWLQGALVEAVADVRDGRADLSVGQTLSRVQPRLGAIIGAGILAGIGIAIGLVLLIVPGLILMTIWSVIIPVIVIERVGVFESFGRSRALVRGNGWPVFAILLITFIVLGIVDNVISLVLRFLPDYLATFVATLLSGTVVAPFLALAVTVVYFELRQRSSATPEPVLPPPAVSP